MKRVSQLLSAIALALPLAAQASVAFQFNPDGIAGGIATINIDILDWAPGNALAVTGNPAGGLVTGSTTQLLYQANLGITKLAGVTNYASGLSGPTFTVVAGFQELATVAGNNAQFALTGAVGPAPSATNFFYIYQSFGNDLAGTGFVGASPIMSGYVSGVNSSNFTYTDFTANPLGCTGGPGTGLSGTLIGGSLCQTKLDGFNSNDWVGTDTMVGSGSTDLLLTITSVNSAYFPDLTPGSVLTTGLINTSQVDPFNQADPSQAFSTNGTVGANHATDLGTINGFNTSAADRDFIFQADANMSLERAVPEPGALALVGLALVGVGAASRRRSMK